MRLSLLAATLATLFVLGVSRHAAASAPQQEAAKDTETKSDEPPEQPDPLAGIAVKYRPYYEQFAELLVPLGNIAKNTAKEAFQLQLNEREKRLFAVVKLGEYNLALDRRGEKTLRTLFATAREKELANQRYLVTVASLIGGKEKADLLASAYERAIDQGADFPANVRTKLVDLIRSPPEEPPQGWQPSQGWRDPEGEISREVTSLRTEFLKQEVPAKSIFRLYLLIHNLGQSVIATREQCRTFHDLLAALPDPHRTNILMRLAWSIKQEQQLDRERQGLMRVEPPTRLSRYQDDPALEAERQEMCLKELRAIAVERRQKFLTLEQARRDVIEGCFTRLDAAGWHALEDLNTLFAQVQEQLNHVLSKQKLEYKLEPLIPAGAPRDDASNVLSKIPLSGSVQDRVPTVVIRDRAKGGELIPLSPPPSPATPPVQRQAVTEVRREPEPDRAARRKLTRGELAAERRRKQKEMREKNAHDYQIEFDAPAGQPSYADLLKPGNVLVGPFWLEGDATTGQVQAELHIATIVEKVDDGIKKNIIEGELLLTPSDGDRESLPLQGWFTPGVFVFMVEWRKLQDGDTFTFVGSREKGEPLAGYVLRDIPLGSFSLSLKK